MAQTIIELLNHGLKANNDDPFRKANLLHLPSDGDLVITGDIHGNLRNFERIVTFADLQNNPKRHLILQEIIHGGPEDSNGRCLSYKLLFDAIRYKLQFPNQIHFIMANHDTAFINNSKVMKNGKEMNESMRSAIKNEFPDTSEDINLAIKQFLFSQPLAARTENKIWISHSLPDNRFMETFDTNIFHRSLKISDIPRPGSVYLLTWGRNHSEQMLKKLSKIFDVDLFVLGHQAPEMGHEKTEENVIILTSEHQHGCMVKINLNENYNTEKLLNSVIPLAAIA